MMALPIRTGVYESDYGNAVAVCRIRRSGVLLAYDLDMDQRIPLDLVTGRRVRNLTPADLQVVATKEGITVGA